MKRYLFAFLIMFLFLFGCHADRDAEVESLPAPTSSPSLTQEIPVVTPTPKPEHSELYISGLAIEDVIRYFNEICLDAEFVTGGGDPTRIQKWNSPIYYHIFGSPTAEDMTQLQSFTEYLNGIYGFPGIYETENEYDANLKIHFCDFDTMIDILGDNFYGCDGGVTFWYEYDVIYDAVICYRTDLSQTVRNSVILEEIYNGLGPVQDTVLRPDSIVFSDFSDPQELSQVDELLLQLLYHPDIQCGMNATECDAVIRELYY